MSDDKLTTGLRLLAVFAFTIVGIIEIFRGHETNGLLWMILAELIGIRAKASKP